MVCTPIQTYHLGQKLKTDVFWSINESEITGDG